MSRPAHRHAVAAAARWIATAALFVASSWTIRGETTVGAEPAPSPDRVVVAVIPHPIPPRKARRALWDCLPKEPAIPSFDLLSNLGWRERYDAFSVALVGKARAQNLEADALERTLRWILAKESVAVVPVAAFRARIGRRDVWIVHLQWELKNSLRVRRTKDGPVLDEHSIWGLGHIRTHAIAIDDGTELAFVTCM